MFISAYRRGMRPLAYVLVFILATASLHIAVDHMLQGQSESSSGPVAVEKQRPQWKKGFQMLIFF
jgi:hypothetical protein